MSKPLAPRRHLTEHGRTTLCGLPLEGAWDTAPTFRRSDCKRCRRSAQSRMLVCYVHCKQRCPPRALEYTYSGKTWADFGPKGAPNPWVTLRALRGLTALTEV